MEPGEARLGHRADGAAEGKRQVAAALATARGAGKPAARRGEVGMGQTVVEKIAQAHMAEGPDAAAAGGRLPLDPAAPRHDARQHLGGDEEVQGDRRDAGRRPAPAGVRPRPRHPEHDRGQPRRSTAAIEAFAREHGIDFYPAGAGIGHQIMVRAGVRRAGLVRRRLRLALQHVRRARRGRHAGRAHRRRRDLGHRRVLVADPAHGAGRARRAGCARASPART